MIWDLRPEESMVEYRCPLRGGTVLCNLVLPRNLTAQEANRLTRFLESLIDVNATSYPETLELPPPRVGEIA